MVQKIQAHNWYKFSKVNSQCFIKNLELYPTMQGGYHFNIDEDPQVERPLFTNRKTSQNDSIGNNSGGIRSDRDQDFDMMDDTYEQKLQNKIHQQQTNRLEQGQLTSIAPQNNPNFHNNTDNHPQISLYDIQANLSSKNISIFNFKKTLSTIIQCLNAFQLDQLTKFVRLIMDLPAFDQTFSKYHRKQKNLEIEPNDLNQVSSDISAKSDSHYALPPSGMQTIFEIAAFLASLIDKCTNIDNMHLIPVIRHILNPESRYFMLPLKPQDLIQQSAQFVQNSNNDSKYQEVQEAIQHSYVSLFQFSDQVNSIKQIWFFYFANRCINNCFKKNSQNYNISAKMKIHALRILNELNLVSSDLFLKFHFNKEENHYIIEQKSEILKMQKQQLEDYSNTLFDYCCKDSTKIRFHLSLVIASLINGENSIEKKSQALKIIEKLIINTRECQETIDEVSKIIQQHSIMSQLMRDQTHSQLLKKLPLIIKFLYELGKIGTQKVKSLIKQAVKGHGQFFKVVQSIVDYLKLKDLSSIFEFVKSLMVEESQLLNTYTVGLIESIVNNFNLAVKRKKKKKKQSRYITHQSELHAQRQIIDEDNAEKNIVLGKSEINELVQDMFKYLFFLIQNPKLQSLYIPILSKHISLHVSILLPLLQQQFQTRLFQPKDYQTYFLSILEHCLKIDLDSDLTDFSQKQTNQGKNNTSETKRNLNQKKIEQSQKLGQKEPRKYQFITNLVLNCNLYDSIFVMLCKCRFDKATTEKCLNVLSLVTKYYKGLEKNHIEILWKILGLHHTNNFEKEQFFIFVKDILKKNVGVSQEAAKHIYFQILLKLSHEYFTPKIYDCLETVFMRLNEDAGVLSYENNKNCHNYYSLNNSDLVGIDKFYYLLLWGEPQVSKKVKDFLFKLYCFKCSAKIKQQLSSKIIKSMMQYLKQNTQSQAHSLFANNFEQLNLHFSRAFDLFSKLSNQSQKFIDQKQQQSNMISVTINNATRQALPPIKKTIEVYNNILLKDFKQLIRKEINPHLSDIELINKGKPLRADRMSLKELKIDNKNTILVENMDVPAAKKQIEDERIKECWQTLKGIFGEQYSGKVLGYVAQKYLGEQLQKICEWVMDEQKMKELEIQMYQKDRFKTEQKNHFTEVNQGHEERILSFGQILMSEIEQLLKVMAKNRQQRQQIIQQNWALKSTIELLLKYQIDKKLSEQILFHLKSHLINPSSLSIPQFYSQLPQLIKGQQLYELVLKYQEVFATFYLSLFDLDTNEVENHQNTHFQHIDYFIDSYLRLKNFIDQLLTDKSRCHNSNNKPIQWLYSLLISYCDLITRYENSHNTSVRPEIFQNDLFESINLLMATSFTLSNNKILGLLALINKLIDRVFTTAQTTSRKLSNYHLQTLLNLTDFLFQPFIFGLKTVPILTHNQIKQSYYLILLKLASSSNEILLKISGNIIKLGIQNRNRDHDNIDFKKDEFVGIQNLGCTCYINSLIQQLYHTRLPYKLITQTNHEGLFELNHTFMQLFMTVKNAINIRPMIQQVKFYGQQIIPTIQQDVEEFLISLLDYIESCQGKFLIDSIFGGSYSEQLTFFSQKNTGETFNKHKQEHFYNITLDIKSKKNLNQALVYFFRPQILDDKIFCEELGQKTPAVKRSFIKHFPKILIFTLKRFEFDVENMVRKKVNDYLEFPQELDLTQFSWQKFIQEQRKKHLTEMERQNEKIIIGNNKNKIRRGETEIEKQNERESHLYMLCGILIHSGSAEAGHYYSYIQRENKWYEFNDKTVAEINLPQIIKTECFGGGDSKSRNAYMLFYERVESNSYENDFNHQNYEKMQIEQPESHIQVQIEKTIPLEVQQRHHGIFLEQIPEDNYFKQLVMDENRHFIKERLLYDFCYRKFIADFIPLIRQAKANNPYQTEFDKREEYLLSEKLVEIQKINNLMNPQAEKPIVHFQSNSMMEIEQMKQVTYEEEERIQQERNRLSRENDIIGEILEETLNHDFI